MLLLPTYLILSLGFVTTGVSEKLLASRVQSFKVLLQQGFVLKTPYFNSIDGDMTRDTRVKSIKVRLTEDEAREN